MASFVEQATLILKDKSTPQINKINSALKQLRATANSMKSIRINLTGLQKASADARRLTSDLNKLKSSGAVTIRVNTSGIAAAQRQVNALRTSGRNIVIGTAHHAAHALAYGAARQVAAGTRTVDIGETSLALKELPKDVGDAVQSAISDISRKQNIFNRGTITQQMSEMLGVVKIGAADSAADATKRVATAKFLAEQNLGLAETFVKLGQDVDEAQEHAIKFGKAMDMQSKIYNKATGDLDVTEATKQFDLVRKLIPAIGKEATGSNFLQLMKYLRTERFSLSDEGTALAMSEFEKMGTTAAVGLNQMVKSLRGETTKSGIAEGIRLGILKAEENVSGTVGGKKSTTRRGVMDEALSKKLFENPQQFVNEDLIPAWKKDLMARKKLTDAQAEAELNKPNVVQDLVSKLGGTATSRDVLTSLVLQRKENAQFLRDFNSRSGSLSRQRADTAYSVIGATTAIQQQTQGLFGEAARVIAPVLVPALSTVSDALRDMAPVLREAAKDPSKLVEGGAASLAIAGLGVAMTNNPVSRAMIKVADTISRPLGYTSGIAAMTDQNPAIRSLGAAGISLLAAADGLKDAAGKLGGTVPGIGGGDSKRPSPSEEMRQRVKGINFGGRFGGALKVANAMRDRLLGEITPIPEAEKAAAVALRDYETAVKEQTFALNRGKKKGARPLSASVLAEYNAKVEHYRQLWLKARSDLYGTPRKVEPVPFSQYLPERGKGKGIPIPKSDPRKSGFTTDPTQTLDLGRQFGEAASTSLATTMSTANNNFSLTFGTLPQKVSEGGKSAGASIVAEMQGGASGIGNAIGAAFAAQASKVRVGVDMSGVKVPGNPDTGSSKPD